MAKGDEGRGGSRRHVRLHRHSECRAKPEGGMKAILLANQTKI
ncbi:hypothetical protein [Streptomyces doebereineriae]|uniref:Uncharacterized protein n=1 Tax=Streptomyces doebereineriae TaxID=3075528 RepID=A0ABU2VGP8_9ACTN|nr:hypothetical protein [Streptomyces sp. DSM 41640]MDT0484483.1 hypothetical protein [Streptomyces sp. DSM 41640]